MCGIHSENNSRIKSKNKKAPIKKLLFYGLSAVCSGNGVIAKIPRYQKEKFREMPHHCYDDGWRERHFDRGYNEKEEAIELSILSSRGKVKRTERPVDYNFFLGQKK